MKISKKIRNEFSGNSSGNHYYDYKGQAIEAFNGTLEKYGFHLDFADCNNWYDDEGRQTVAILTNEDDDTECVETGNYAIFTWYLMESGRWEIIGYIG